MGFFFIIVKVLDAKEKSGGRGETSKAEKSKGGVYEDAGSKDLAPFSNFTILAVISFLSLSMSGWNDPLFTCSEGYVGDACIIFDLVQLAFKLLDMYIYIYFYY